MYLIIILYIFQIAESEDKSAGGVLLTTASKEKPIVGTVYYALESFCYIVLFEPDFRRKMLSENLYSKLFFVANPRPQLQFQTLMSMQKSKPYWPFINP